MSVKTLILIAIAVAAAVALLYWLASPAFLMALGMAGATIALWYLSGGG